MSPESPRWKPSGATLETKLSNSQHPLMATQILTMLRRNRSSLEHTRYQPENPDVYAAERLKQWM